MSQTLFGKKNIARKMMPLIFQKSMILFYVMQKRKKEKNLTMGGKEICYKEQQSKLLIIKILIMILAELGLQVA